MPVVGAVHRIKSGLKIVHHLAGFSLACFARIALAPSPQRRGEFHETIADNALPKEERDESWEQFVVAYRSEMSEQRTAIDELRRRHESGDTLSLLCACHDPARCHRTVLADLVLAD